MLTPQGNEFELIKNNDAEPLTNVGGTTKSGVSTTIGSASINNIPQNAEKSNADKKAIFCKIFIYALCFFLFNGNGFCEIAGLIYR